MNTEEIEDIFKDVVKDKGILGAASYEDVFHHLMPVQRKNLSEQGVGKSLIVFGIFHSHKAIQSINVRKNGKQTTKHGTYMLESTTS